MKKTLCLIFLCNLAFSQIPTSLDSIRVNESVNPNVPLHVFINSLSSAYRVNITVDRDVKVTDNFRFYNTSIKKILEFIITKYDLDYTVQNDIVRLKKKFVPPPVKPQPKPKEVGVKLADSKISFSVTNESIHSVMEKVSDLTGTSYLVDPRLKQSVSGNLKNAPIQEGVEAFLDVNGLQLVKSGSIIKVMQKFGARLDTKSGKSNEGFFAQVTDTLITVNAYNAKLRNIIEELVRQANVKFSYFGQQSKQQAPMITATIRESNLEDVFLKLFRNTNYTFKIEDDTYYFGDKSIKDLILEEVIPLRYLQAATGAESSYNAPSTLSLPNSGQFRGQTFGNSNLNRNNTRQNSNLNTNRRNTQQTNRPRSNSNPSNQIGYSADALFQQLEDDNIYALPLVEQNAILVRGTKQDIEDARNLVSILDKPIPQIFIEALIIDIKDNVNLSREIEAYRAGKGADTISASTSYIPFKMLFNAKDLNPVTQKIGKALGAKRIGTLPDDFFAFINIQETKDNLQIKSRPQITTSNGREAYISIGQTQYFLLNETRISDNQNSQNVQNVNQRYQKLDIVETLRVRPWANSQGEVTVQVVPVFQLPIAAPPGSNLPPDIEFRELDSTVRVKNGQTLILGGLIKDRTSDITRDYFPLLSWIPWIGEWFKSKTKDTGRSELLIYITPHVYYGDDYEPNLKKSDF